MPLSHLPALLASAFCALAHWLDRRSAARLPLLLCGILLATSRRTVTSWFRAAGIREEFRPAYTTVCAVGRHTTQRGGGAAHQQVIESGRVGQGQLGDLGRQGEDHVVVLHRQQVLRLLFQPVGARQRLTLGTAS